MLFIASTRITGSGMLRLLRHGGLHLVVRVDVLVAGGLPPAGHRFQNCLSYSRNFFQVAEGSAHVAPLAESTEDDPRVSLVAAALLARLFVCRGVRHAPEFLLDFIHSSSVARRYSLRVTMFDTVARLTLNFLAMSFCATPASLIWTTSRACSSVSFLL